MKVAFPMAFTAETTMHSNNLTEKPSPTTSNSDLTEISKSLRRQLNSAANEALVNTFNSETLEENGNDAFLCSAPRRLTASSSKCLSRRDDVESDYFYTSHYFSRTDATSSSSSETDSSSEDEHIIAEFASKFPPAGQSPHTRQSKVIRSDARQPMLAPVTTPLPLPGSLDETTPALLAATEESINGALASGPSSSQYSSNFPLPPTTLNIAKSTKDETKRRRRSVAANRRSVLLRCMRQYRAECQQFETAQKETSRQSGSSTEQNQHSSSSSVSASEVERKQLSSFATHAIGHLWAEILALIVSGFLDLKSIINLRQCCTRLYYKRRYSLATCTFEQLCTVTEQELINKVFHFLSKFLTARSFSQLNFSRCCLLTDTFPKAIKSLHGGKIARHLRSLHFDFCYALTDKALETLLMTSFHHLEIFSVRCARSKDLTGAPFSQKDMLTKDRWPRFHQFSCSCTQIALPHLDAVALFVSERAAELGVSPKLGIAGSLASNSLIRRLGLESEQKNFFEKIIFNETPEAVLQAISSFEKQWNKNIDEGENKNKVLHKLLRTRAVALLVNAPCSMAIVDDGEGREKAMWVLLNKQRQNRLIRSQIRDEPTASLVNTPVAAGCSSAISPSVSNFSTAFSYISNGGLNSSYTSIAQGSVVESIIDPEKQVLPFESCCSCSHFSGHVGLVDESNGLARTSSDTKKPSYRPGHTQENFSANPITINMHSPTSSAAFSTFENHGFPSAVKQHFFSAVSCVRTNSSGADGSGSETDRASTTSTAVQLAAQNPYYLRWSYPLPVAIRLGNLLVVQLLVQKGAHLDVWGYTFATPLYTAVVNVPRHESPSLLSKVSSSDEFGSIYASSVFRDDIEAAPEANDLSDNDLVRLNTYNSLAVTDFSTENVGVHSSSGASHLSGSNGSTRYAEVSECNVDVATKTSTAFGTSFICQCHCHLLSQNNFKELENRRAIVDFLLKCGAPVDAPDLYAAKCPVNAAIKNDNQALLETLIAAGAKINVRALPQGVIPPLILMSRQQQEKKQSKLGMSRLGSKSPLFYACEVGAKSCIETLLSAGADPNWTDPFSNRTVTPTLLAYRKNLGMLQLFVRKGSGSTKATRWVLSEVLAAAILQDDLNSIQFLVSSYKDLLERENSGMWSLPLLQAARLNKAPVLKLLLDLGADVNAVNSQTFTAIHIAASEGHKQVLECMLQYGAKPNITGGPKLRTPIHVAVEENRKDCVEVLLNYGGDLTIKDSAGLTPLMTAISFRNDKVAMLLIQRATVEALNITDASNRSALMYATYFGQFKVADALVTKGVSCCLMDNAGCTAEVLLKQKIQSLGKSTSSLSINKILRNIIGGGVSSTLQSSAGSGRLKAAEAESSMGIFDSKTQNPQTSEESVRKLNTKRKKVAKRLLKKIYTRAKKEVLSISNTTGFISTSSLLHASLKQVASHQSPNIAPPTIVSTSDIITNATDSVVCSNSSPNQPSQDSGVAVCSGDEYICINSCDNIIETVQAFPSQRHADDEFQVTFKAGGQLPEDGDAWSESLSSEDNTQDDLSGSSSNASECDAEKVEKPIIDRSEKSDII